MYWIELNGTYQCSQVACEVWKNSEHRKRCKSCVWQCECWRNTSWETRVRRSWQSAPTALKSTCSVFSCILNSWEDETCRVIFFIILESSTFVLLALYDSNFLLSVDLPPDSTTVARSFVNNPVQPHSNTCRVPLNTFTSTQITETKEKTVKNWELTIKEITILGLDMPQGMFSKDWSLTWFTSCSSLKDWKWYAEGLLSDKLPEWSRLLSVCVLKRKCAAYD